MDTNETSSWMAASRQAANIRIRRTPFLQLHFRSFHFFLLLAAICWCALGPLPIALARTNRPAPAASVAGVTGREAGLAGTKMAPGATLFPGDLVRLGESSTAALRFGESLVFADSHTELTVEPEGLNLRRGHVQVRAAGQERFKVQGALFRLDLKGQGGVPGSAEIRVESARSLVSAASGIADLTAERSGIPYRLRPGETVSLEAAGGNSPPQNPAGPKAGKVTRLIPVVKIERGSQSFSAAVDESVYWEDDLQSGPEGRARVTLDDGSLLSLGSNSSLLIVQHDSQAQQTLLDLIIGRLRTKVVKLTRPGGKFEIRTPVGVAGLVGTDVSLQVTNDFVELMVMEGAAQFTLLNGQSLLVTAGMFLRISRAGVFAAPRTATQDEIQTAQQQTDTSGSNNNRNNPNAVIFASLGTGAVVLGVSIYRDSQERQPIRQPITPSTLGNR